MKNKRIKNKEEPMAAEEQLENLEGLEFTEDDDNILLNEKPQEKSKEDLVPNHETPHPMVQHYNYLIDLESRIIQIENLLSDLVESHNQLVKSLSEASREE